MLLDLWGLLYSALPLGGLSGSSKSRSKAQLVVVDVDGKTYRVKVDELPQFLDAIKSKVEEKKSVRTRKKKGRNTVVVAENVPKVVLRKAPDGYVEIVKSQIDRSNDAVLQIWNRLVQRYLAELDDEEALVLLFA
jgi:hypothetical protein